MALRRLALGRRRADKAGLPGRGRRRKEPAVDIGVRRRDDGLAARLAPKPRRASLRCPRLAVARNTGGDAREGARAEAAELLHQNLLLAADIHLRGLGGENPGAAAGDGRGQEHVHGLGPLDVLDRRVQDLHRTVQALRIQVRRHGSHGVHPRALALRFEVR